MRKIWLAMLLLLLLCACAGPAKSSVPEKDTDPYKQLTEAERSCVSAIQSGLSADMAALRTAVRVNGVCYYGTLEYAKDLTLPTGAKYAGELLQKRCAACTTPNENLQAEERFAMAGRVTVYMHGDEPFFVNEQGEVMHLAGRTTTPPPYYDDGRWMLEPENE